MSKRDAQAIQQDYVQTCAELGELELKVTMVKQELTNLNDQKNNRVQKLTNLNKEFTALKQEQSNVVELPKAEEAPSEPVQAQG